MLRESSFHAIIACTRFALPTLVVASALALANCGSSGGGAGGSTSGRGGGASSGSASGGASSNGGGSSNGSGASSSSNTGPSGAGGSTGSGPDLCAGVSCTASDVCHAVGTCDSKTGICSNPNAPDNTPCDLGQGCTAADGCIAGVCKKRDPSDAAVDQAQLTANTETAFDQDIAPGQNFTVGKTGWLTGIETSIKANGGDTTVTIQLDLYDNASNTKIATASLPATTLGASPGGALSATTVGNAFFDLSSTCLAVTAGQSLYFSLTLEAKPFVPFCFTGPDSTVCLQGQFAGKNCTFDSECVSFQFGSSTGNPYAGGEFQPVTLVPDATQDLTFKTFIE